MRFLSFCLAGAFLVSCEEPTADLARRLAELERRAAAAEERADELELQATEREIAAERDAIERERLSLEEDRYELISLEDGTKAEAERELLAREHALAARENRTDRMQDELDRDLDQLEDLSDELDQRERELAGREALATVREEVETQPVADYNIFYNSLSPYGSWFETPDYGYVWQPAVVRDVSWRPYTRGRWVCTDHGWTWVSNEPFGWATYHYGRWARLAHRGWIWVPGSRWAPAWVCWRYGPRHVGWAPLPPESLAYRHRVWGTNVEATLGIGASWFCFVETRNFCAPIRQHCLPYARNSYFCGRTRNVTRIHTVRGRTICGGPTYGAVARQVRGKVPFHRLETNQRGRVANSRARLSNGRLRVYAPNVDAGWNAGLRPKRVRGSWGNVAVQRDRQPAREVRDRYRESRQQSRQQADREIQRLGGPARFPAQRRNELVSNRRPTDGGTASRRPTVTPQRRDLSKAARPNRVNRKAAEARPVRQAIHRSVSRSEQPRPATNRTKPGTRKVSQTAASIHRQQARRELEDAMQRSAARESQRQAKLRDARRQQAETAARETARRQQQARQNELVRRTREQRNRIQATPTRKQQVSPPRWNQLDRQTTRNVVQRPPAIQRTAKPRSSISRPPQQVVRQQRNPSRVRDSRSVRVQRQTVRRQQTGRRQRVEQGRDNNRGGRQRKSR